MDCKLNAYNSRNMEMDSAIEKDSTGVLKNLEEEVKNESAENFQKFIYELFENNGVINDLRAYLRGHIVGVLKSVQTGEPPPCQKHFTQRLELQYQALNIIIVEYLLRMEFNFSLSVFVSEIPLANMVFGFARSVMESSMRDPGLRFTSQDVWAVLNYLGIKCDSEHATKIAEMYEGGNGPLLLCLIQCTPIYRVRVGKHDAHKISSEESLTSSEENEDTSLKQSNNNNKCRHYVACNTCQGKMARVRDKYKRKKINLAQSMKEYNFNSDNMQTALENVEVTERNIIDEMFNQLKCVYESEMDMLRKEAENRVKRSLATNEILLQRKREELEEQYKSRVSELDRNMYQRKRFLWGLARQLKTQHAKLASAMTQLRTHTDCLADKEETLKAQISEAEKLLRDRGEDMRKQISQELSILENHLEAMKAERATINREKLELDRIKRNNIMNNKEELRIQYDSFKNEFTAMKKYLEASFESKCVVERGTMTNFSDSTKIDAVLNNGQDVRKSEVGERVVNDLKRHKNVNNQCDHDNVEPRSVSRSSSEAGESRSHLAEVKRLYDHNKRLSDFAAQQREHIAELTSTQARLHAELAIRPRTAPSMPSPYCLHNSVNPTASVNNIYTQKTCHAGSGEQLFFNSDHPRMALPGHVIPFIGAKERRVDTRRYLIDQWRCLRRRLSPASHGMPPHTHHRMPSTGVTIPSESAEENDNNIDLSQHSGHEHGVPRECESTKSAVPEMKIRERSPTTVLREAKDRLKTHGTEPSKRDQSRENSPTSVLREAKKRLRRLEIEAEAVEKSYKDYRRRQESGKHFDDTTKVGAHKTDFKAKGLLTKNPHTSALDDFNIHDYYAKFDIGETHFYNKNATKSQVKPIPNTYSPETEKKLLGKNYLDTPLMEFRGFYHSDKRKSDLDIHDNADLHKDITTHNIKDIRPESPVNKNIENSLNNSVPQINGNLEISGRSKSVVNEDIEIKQNDSNCFDFPKESNLADLNSLIIPILSTEASEASINSKDIKDLNNKTKELKILESNIKKIYNIPEKYNLNETSYGETNKNDNSDDKLIEIIKTKKEYDECDDNLLETIEMDKENDKSDDINPFLDEISKEQHSPTNLLRIEVENITQDVKITESDTQDLIVVLETSIDREQSDIVVEDELSVHTTIILSPKNDKKSDEANKSEIMKKIEQNEILNHIYDAPPEVKSSVEIDLSKDLNVELDQTEDLDYPDDFSADVDNYNTRSENASPMSILRTSEDENFWES